MADERHSSHSRRALGTFIRVIRVIRVIKVIRAIRAIRAIRIIRVIWVIRVIWIIRVIRGTIIALFYIIVFIASSCCNPLGY